MAVFEPMPQRPWLTGFPRRGYPHHRFSGSAARTGIGSETAPYHVVDELALLGRPRAFGPVLLVLAMLASAGAGASLTFAIMDYQPKRSVAVAAQPSAAGSATGSVAAREETTVPHNIWAPFVKTIPSVGFRRPPEAPVE